MTILTYLLTYFTAERRYHAYPVVYTTKSCKQTRRSRFL